MQTITEVREDPPEEIAESSWPVKTSYEWVAVDVRNQSLLFRWSRLLKSWLNCTPIVGRDVSRDIVSLERVSAVERVCHDQEGMADKFFYMPSISRWDTFTPSFKHFKDEFFKMVVKDGGRLYFFNDDGSTKFPFSWMDNPWRYKDMKLEKLSVADKEVVEVLMKFTDRLPTKGLVRIYNLVHPIIDIEGHMAQLGKINLTLFQTLRKEKAARTKATGGTEVPNLQESLVEVHVHGGTRQSCQLCLVKERM
ncbi:hypothetical protein DEO72_LG8g1515 [Vigna unguiculata]|uniref:Uncharacterized protein n=1 Tax=Vigna unguiculata TaxID=3917 RepID=A0A4D6MPL8_VIGUN|nr:hypothetical protein DEO72_LG8g1515 [Vigna unguiculata]